MSLSLRPPPAPLRCRGRPPVPGGRHGGWFRSCLFLLRALASRNVRDNDFAIVALGVVAATLIAGGVALLQKAVGLLHSVLFDLPRGAHLSAGVAIGPWQPLIIPMVGRPMVGRLALGIFGSFARRLRAKDIVDPIEANALYGGTMSLLDSLRLAASTVPVTLGVLTSMAVATMIVRRMFGHSFATWRFHLRGLPIHGARDIGWIENLTVGRMMRRDAKSVPASMSLAGLRRMFARSADAVLLPGQNVRSALELFTNTEEESLPVVESATTKRLLGYLTEAYALRRYNQELERKRAEELGERHLFG